MLKNIVMICIALTLLIVGQSLFAICGDADSSGSVDISDAVYLITFIFGAGPAPIPIESGDADNNGAVDISDAVYIISYIFAGGPEPCPDPSGALTDHSACKDQFLIADSISTSEGCIVYEYDGSQLLLTHVNAGFNCCPVILADLLISGNDISIIEIDSLNNGTGCSCLCLFDLEFEINYLPAGEYHIYVEEPYRDPQDPVLDFIIDLSSPIIDTFCVSRSVYPWGEPWK